MSIVSVTFQQSGVAVFTKRVDIGILSSESAPATRERAAQLAMADWEHGRKWYPDKAPPIAYDTVVINGVAYPAATPSSSAREI